MATKSRRYKCVVCGIRIKAPLKFKHGEVCICHRNQCNESLSFKSQNFISIGAFSIQDLSDNEVACPEAIKAFKDNEKVVRDLTQVVTDALWDNDSVGDIFQESLMVAGITLEEKYINSLKDTDLPLIPFYSLKTDEARNLLEKRIKGV